MEAFIKSVQLGRTVQRFRVPHLRVLAQGTAFALLYYAFLAEKEKFKNSRELELKKERLSMPVYEMTEEDLQNPPWSGKHYENWKYRLVKVTGRQIHNHTMFIPRKVHNYPGFDYIVPVVVKENAQLKDQVGVLVNKGFMPHEYKELVNRARLEDAIYPYEFVGMLNRGEDLDRSAFFKKDNAWDEQRFIFNNFFLPDMARATGFTNKKAVEQGVIEVLDLEETELDEKNPNFYNKNMSGTTTFPYQKTLAGALQPPESNDRLLRKQIAYVALAALCLLY